MSDLSDHDLALLRRLTGRIIPASAEYDAPGADDAAIFEDIAALLRPKAGVLRGLLDAGDAALDDLRQSQPAALAVLMSAVAQGYYRDARVMRALDMEPRPPFPEGYTVDDGDWSLLDPVRARPPVWRAPG